MSNLPTTALPDWQRERLTLLLDALDGVPITDAERCWRPWAMPWWPWSKAAGHLAAVDGTLVLRGVLNPIGHMAWTGTDRRRTMVRPHDGGRAGPLARWSTPNVLAVVLNTLRVTGKFTGA